LYLHSICISTFACVLHSQHKYIYTIFVFTILHTTCIYTEITLVFLQ